MSPLEPGRRDRPEVVLTIGHSTRPLEDFIRLLREHKVETLVDVRTIPRSRRNPQFNSDDLRAALENAGITYVHMKGLGGLRHSRKDSPNLGWVNASFRGYADYMQTEAFAAEVGELMRLASARRAAIMCAEAVPWRCHRSLIADALAVRGVPVEHIVSGRKTRPHVITGWARVQGLSITYPAAESGEQAASPTSSADQGRR